MSKVFLTIFDFFSLPVAFAKCTCDLLHITFTMLTGLS